MSKQRQQQALVLFLCIAVFGAIIILFRSFEGSPQGNISQIRCESNLTVSYSIVGEDKVAKIQLSERDIHPFECQLPAGTYKTVSGCSVTSGEGNLKDVQGEFTLAGEPGSFVDLTINCDSSFFEGSFVNREILTEP